MILHLDLDSFFVSVERILNPDLIGKPVIVGGSGNRGVVSSCSYEARAFGVRSAMPMMKARALCPHAVTANNGYREYGKYSKMVTDIIAEKSPQFQKASIDEFYIDVSGMDKYFGAEKWSHSLRNHIIKETGLPISWGLAANKLLAKMCTQDAKPNGTYVIPLGEEQQYLDPKPVGTIPFVGEKMVETLARMRIHTIADLRAFEQEALMRRFGKNGMWLWQKARGIDHSQVHSGREEKSVSCERTFSNNISNRKEMKHLLFTLCEKLSFELRSKQWQTGCVTVKIRFSNFETHSHQKQIIPEFATPDLYAVAEKLLDELWEDNVPLRLIGIRFSDLSGIEDQLTLFDNSETKRNYFSAVDKLKAKYGKGKLFFGGNME
jgi:DNA polymerase-4